MAFIDIENVQEKSFDSELEAYAKEKFVPIVSKKVANILSQIVQDDNIKNILEIGTAIGYSGSVMLNSNKNAKLDTIEIDLDRFNFAKNVFESKGLFSRVNQILADAGDTILNLDKKYDLIFLDGPKAHYLGYAPTLIDLLNEGGILFADNVGQHGTIFDGKQDDKHKALIHKMEQYLEYILKRKDLETKIYNIGDGISISVLKNIHNK